MVILVETENKTYGTRRYIYYTILLIGLRSKKGFEFMSRVGSDQTDVSDFSSDYGHIFSRPDSSRLLAFTPRV